MSSNTFTAVASYSDRLSAEAILGLLKAEGIPAYISSNDHVPGLGTHFAVYVANDLTRRAQWVLQQTHVTEGELTDLAMGAAQPRPEDEPP